MSNTTLEPTKAAVIAHWNRRAADFDAGPTHGLLNPAQDAAWRAVMAQLAPATPALDVLDVGCGTGFLALLLAEASHRATGIDLAEEMLAIARPKAAARGLDVPFLAADAEAPGLPANSFDLVVERHVLWTLPDPARALRAWRDLLRPGGRVALVEGAWWDMQARDEYASIHAALPLFGGRPAEQLAAPLIEAGFAAPQVVPLMDPALWTQAPKHERYLVVATRAEA
ncbi:class I SAM-dependent methyltransferase [Falsiroseomonas tokyonensis]|uniref:Class I SAM-dependent methyltransferase n=1 Tax=Falsiroseomonas tokyonensis TaxID=430521 RepID=A0ABV7BMM1_9PROT|nr:class I SAM-dependent methyltransferase [Falsiroseomonas tokyonensis]MBU8536825.1 class I SAM-dependent methyltransferase [Falsiroseomonas tokyonensis]